MYDSSIQSTEINQQQAYYNATDYLSGLPPVITPGTQQAYYNATDYLSGLPPVITPGTRNGIHSST